WLMMSLWDALRMNMMISYQELVRTFPNTNTGTKLINVIVIGASSLIYKKLVTVTHSYVKLFISRG
ncbi:hypothetical protein, partial [Klebsiella pneumoniae]|uniref:hypothetical protein n=1 Tax=Klebsiella pneumoniae TaxID=573 RepID=UPI0022B0238C